MSQLAVSATHTFRPLHPRQFGLVAPYRPVFGYRCRQLLGAILLTGYLGGAVAPHVRVGHSLFSHVLFGAYLDIALWGRFVAACGLVRALLPVIRKEAHRASDPSVF